MHRVGVPVKTVGARIRGRQRRGSRALISGYQIRPIASQSICAQWERHKSDTSRDKLLENVDPLVGYVLVGAHGFGAGKTPLLDNGTMHHE